MSELGQEDENGFTNFMTIKDIDQYVLEGTVLTGKSLSIYLTRCQPDSSPVPCAEESKIDEFISKHAINFSSIESFIDYDNVETGDTAVKQFWKSGPLIFMEEGKRLQYNFNEHLISLEDSIF